MNTRIRVGAAVALLSTAAACWATSTDKPDLARLVQAADLIVEGQVLSAEPTWIGRRLYTRYQVRVAETLHGDPRASVPVLVPGGVDMNRKPFPIAMAVAGAPALLTNERAVLLLRRTSSGLAAGEFTVVGLGQGRFTLAADRVVPAGEFAAARSAGVPEAANAFRARLRALIHEHANRGPNAAPRRERLP